MNDIFAVTDRAMSPRHCRPAKRGIRCGSTVAGKHAGSTAFVPEDVAMPPNLVGRHPQQLPGPHVSGIAWGGSRCLLLNSVYVVLFVLVECCHRTIEGSMNQMPRTLGVSHRLLVSKTYAIASKYLFLNIYSCLFLNEHTTF